MDENTYVWVSIRDSLPIEPWDARVCDRTSEFFDITLPIRVFATSATYALVRAIRMVAYTPIRFILVSVFSWCLARKKSASIPFLHHKVFVRLLRFGNVSLHLARAKVTGTVHVDRNNIDIVACQEFRLHGFIEP